MTKVQNVSGEALTVPDLGGRMVLAGQAVDVPEGATYGYTQQTTTWAPYDDQAKAEHAEGAEDYDRRTMAQDPQPTTPLEPPAGNASRDEWIEYVLGARLATPEQIDGKGRDELRDTYGPQES